MSVGKSEPAREEIVLCVLAGGASRRFGKPKAGMMYQGQPILTHLARSFSSLGASQRMVSLARDAAIAPPPGAAWFGRMIFDPQDYAGPLHGIAHVLATLSKVSERQADATFVAFVAVDMPCIPVRYLLRLVDALHRQPSCAVAMGRWRDGPRSGDIEPLPSVWRLSAGRKLATQAVTANERSLQRLAGRDEMLTVALSYQEEGDWFVNINRPGDLG